MSWRLPGRSVLITGATSGIGYQAALALAGRGAQVTMVGRDPTRTAAAASEVRSRSGNREITHLVCDLSSQAAVRALAAEVRERLPRLEVLVNNAGGVHARREVTVDGIEATFAVNHLAYFLLTNLLLDLLVASSPARVVSVASAAHHSGTLDFDDLGFERGGYRIMRAYARSKLANVLFANELARRLAGTGVTSNSLHPGAVATHIWAGAPAWTKPLIFLVFRPFFISAEAGGAHVVEMVADPALADVSGRYFDRGRQVAPSPLAQDEALARRLWEVSAQMVGL